MTLDRTQYIGSSDVAAILGASPWVTPFMLYQKKIGNYVEEISEEKQKLFTRGKRWEPIVIEMLVDELKNRGHTVEIINRNQRYFDTKYPFLTAEIDCELLIDCEEVNVEAKTVSPFALRDWGDQDSDAIPVYYTAQVMHGLMIKPRRRAVVAALTGFDDKPRIHWIERDDEIIEGIREKELEFWQRIQNRNAPEPCAIEDVKWLYQRDNGKAIEADDELVLDYQKLKDTKEKSKHDEALIESLENKIKSRMGEAATLLYRGQALAIWKTQTSNRFNSKAFEVAHPDLYAQFRKESESRVFRLK